MCLSPDRGVEFSARFCPDYLETSRKRFLSNFSAAVAMIRPQRPCNVGQAEAWVGAKAMGEKGTVAGDRNLRFGVRSPGSRAGITMAVMKVRGSDGWRVQRTNYSQTVQDQ